MDKKIAQNALEFLDRTPINGREVKAFVEVQVALHQIIKVDGLDKKSKGDKDNGK